MKHILIPTQLIPDTVNAVKAAIKYSNSWCTVTLLLLHEINNSFSAAAMLRNTDNNMTQSQKRILQDCRDVINGNAGCNIRIHNQLNISAPLIKNIIHTFTIDLIIIPANYEHADKKIHRQCLQILLNNKSPILHLGPYCSEQDFNTAFYIEYNTCNVKAEAVIQVIKKILPVETVTSKRIFSDTNDNHIPPQLAEAILTNNTDLLIKTRRPERVSLTKNIKSPADKLGISVLSILEDAI